MKALDICQLPLSGTHLIEASAGTGKTFTLAHLYLRLIVERDLEVDKILVVTFTRAAVQELRTRLRQIIVEARQALQMPVPGEGLIAQILAPHRHEPDLARRLEAAQLSMDQASISTIHTFCAQLLGDNAFESGQLFDMQVEESDTELQLQAVQAYWRERYLALEPEQADWVYRALGSPAQLLGEVAPLLGANPPRLLPAADAEALARERLAARTLWDAVGRQWAAQRAELLEQLRGSSDLSRSKVQLRTIDKAAAWLDEQLAGAAALPGAVPEFLKVLRQPYLDASAKKGKQAPQHTFFVQFDQLLVALQPQAARQLAVALDSCARYVRRWLSERKAQLRVMAYDDLLLLAAEALRGEGAEALAERLRVQYPAALIDEFQDTDPRQYQIFSALYAGQPDLAWYMIGDPKQAIYSFRGADLNTYLQAVGRADQQHTLGTNWRSSGAMVGAVNALFAQAEEPFNVAAGNAGRVVFTPVTAGSAVDDKPLVSQGRAAPALRLSLLPGEDDKAITKGVATGLAARQAARLIVEQLGAGQRGELCIGAAPVQASDIAVLVRSNRQGVMMREALAAEGVASVLTGSDSIFASDEAEDLQRLLQALADPGAERPLSRVLVSKLGGLDDAQLLHLQGDDLAWREQCEGLRRYAELLRRRGVLAALLALMADQRCAARLRRERGGERCLSNYLQLGELLQEAWQQQPDLESLQAWLRQHREAPGGAGDIAQLRLETDQRLVQIVTVHKSKGLEYPLVYLPFAWAGSKGNSGERVSCRVDGEGCIDLGSETIDEHREQMQAERLAEDVRLLYVALTRSSHQCTVLWGDVSGAGETAMAHLLGQRGERVAAGFAEPFRQWIEELEWGESVAPGEGAAHLQDFPEPRLSARRGRRPPSPSWQMTSYTALVRHAGGHAELPDHDAADKRLAAEEAPPEPDLDSILFFPRGAQAGTLLHYIFENADFTRPEAALLSPLVGEALAGHGFADSWRTAVLRMLQEVLSAPLPPVPGLSLSRIANEDRLVEMGFHFPVPSLRDQSLVSLLREHGVLGAGETLEFDRVSGYLTGFVDLIFRFEGRFYILDYKSNHLGYREQDYNPQALQAAMREHRYDLQYLIYTVALQRYLRTRLRDFDYERHMGGSFYLFLRGVGAGDDSANGVFFDRPARELVDALDRLFSPAPEVFG